LPRLRKASCHQTTHHSASEVLLTLTTPSAVKGFNIFAGPEADYLISAKQKGNRINDDLKSQFKKFDAGIDIGVGYDFLSSLGIDFRYGLGLHNLNNTGIGISAKNRTVQIYFIVKCLEHSG